MSRRGAGLRQARLVLVRVGPPWRAAPDRAIFLPDEQGRDKRGGADFGFRRVPKQQKAPLVRAVFDSVAPRYDLMNDLMSGGIHRSWKAEMVAWLKPRPGQRLLDVAGGTGDIAIRALPRLVPAERGAGSAQANGGGVVVCDVNERDARRRPRPGHRSRHPRRDRVALRRCRALPIADRCVDLYTIAFGLRNVTQIEAALAEARRVLKPGGRFLCLEFTPEVDPAAAAALRSLQLSRAAAARPDRRRRPRRLCISGREHPPLPAAGELAEMIAAAGLGRVALSQPDRAASPRSIRPGGSDPPRPAFGMLRSVRNIARLLAIALILARHDALFLFDDIAGHAAPMCALSRILLRRRRGGRRSASGPAARRGARRAGPELYQARPDAVDPRRFSRRTRSRPIWRPAGPPAAVSRQRGAGAGRGRIRPAARGALFLRSTRPRSPPPRSRRCISP